VRIPRQCNISPIDENDPLKYYFKPLVGQLFKERLRMALRLLGRESYEKLLEVGYGSGVFLPELKERCRELYGVDCHEEREKVRQMMAREGIEGHLLTGNISRLEFPENYFDAVVCMSTLEHLSTLEGPLQEVRRVLKDEGKAVFGFPQKGKIMSFLFRSIGFRGIRNHHVHGSHEILKFLKRVFLVERVKTLPPFFPARLSLYTVASCRKR